MIFIVGIPYLGGCGGGQSEYENKRSPLGVSAPKYDIDDLYRFFAIAFGAAPGTVYMGQLLEAADSGLSIKEIVNIFTTKTQFTDRYPLTLTNQEFAARLVVDVVGLSASDQVKQEGISDIEAALTLAKWTRGDVIYTIFSNLARKSTSDTKWGATSLKMSKQVEYAKYYTETMKGGTTELTTLRSIIKSVDQDSPLDSTLIAKNIQIAISSLNNKAILIANVSANSVVATESVNVNLLNWDPSKPTTVLMKSGGQTINLTWRHVAGSNGEMIVTLPPKIIDIQLNTEAYSGVVEIGQNDASSSFQISVTDLPKLSDYGTEPGEITRALLLAGLHLRARTSATLQALRECGDCFQSTMNLSSLSSSIALRDSMVRSGNGWMDAIAAIAQGSSVEMTFPGSSAGATPTEALLTRESIILTDRILGLLLLRDLERRGALTGPRRHALDAKRGQDTALGAVTVLGFKPEVLKIIVSKEVKSFLEGTASIADTGTSVFKTYDSAPGEFRWFDAVKAVGGVIGGAALVAGLFATGTAVAAAASPLALGAAVIAYGVGIVSGGELLANAYDYTTSENSKLKEIALKQMAEASEDLLGAALSTAPIGKAVANKLQTKGISTPNVIEPSATTATVGNILSIVDNGKKTYDAYEYEDKNVRADLVRKAPKIAVRSFSTLAVEMSGENTKSPGQLVEISLTNSAEPDNKIIKSAGSGNGTTKIPIPPQWRDKKPDIVKAQDPENQSILASTPINPQVLANGGQISLGASCAYPGGYAGNFWGTSMGGVNVSVFGDGRIKGGGQSNSGQLFYVDGSLTPSGQFEAAIAGSTSRGASFAGALFSDLSKWSIRGVWNNGPESGQFLLSKPCK
jgi:hypothetical protein